MSQRRSDGPVAAAERLDLGAVAATSETHVGRVRSINQDAHGDWRDADSTAHLFFIADGMGGHRGGEVASRLAVEHVGRVFADGADDPEPMLRSAFEQANSEIHQRAAGDFELAGMGTTGVALLLTRTARAWVAHVGDSRAYRLRDGSLELLTGDHSVVGELVRRGQLTEEQARVHPQSNEILRAIGTQPHVEVEIQGIEIRPGDRFLLCSDGLNGMLPDPEIARLLADAATDEAAHRLIEGANAAGGTDNVTLQIIEIPRAAEATDASAANAKQPERAPGAEAAAAGSPLRWIVALILFAALLLLLFGSADPGR